MVRFSRRPSWGAVLHDHPALDYACAAVATVLHLSAATQISLTGVSGSDWLAVLGVLSGGVLAVSAFVLTPLTIILGLPSTPTVDTVRARFGGQLTGTFVSSTMRLFVLGGLLAACALLQNSSLGNGARPLASGVLTMATLTFWRILRSFSLVMGAQHRDQRGSGHQRAA